MNKLNYKAFIAELIGTFALVFFGCGTAITVGCSASEGTGYLLTALAFGLVIVAMAYAIGGVSGCHVNPAVTLAVLINKGISVADAIGYWIAQFVGGILGGALLTVFATGSAAKALGSNGIIKAANSSDPVILKSFVLEVILTFIFVLVILGVTSDKTTSHMGGIVIGLSLTLVHILGIHYTGTSVNPARSLGVAIFATDKTYLANVWVFILAPLAGAALAALFWKFIRPQVSKKKK